MAVHQLQSALNRLMLNTSVANRLFNLPGRSGQRAFKFGSGAPTGTADAEFYFNISSAATASTRFYANVSGTWTAINFAGANDDFGASGLLTDIIGESTTSAGVTVPASQTLIVTTADKLTVGGVIVPQQIELQIDLWPHASLVTRNLFYATVGWTVTSIVYEPDIAEGTGSVVCTVCKVTGNNVAVAATTPMCTAFAVTGTAGTPVVATLTGTAADLVLAATNKIGCIFSGGDTFLDSGRGRLYIKMKRS